jgi:hypothetical protein
MINTSQEFFVLIILQFSLHNGYEATINCPRGRGLIVMVMGWEVVRAAGPTLDTAKIEQLTGAKAS